MKDIIYFIFLILLFIVLLTLLILSFPLLIGIGIFLTVVALIGIFFEIMNN
jgi:hypothetical protein